MGTWWHVHFQHIYHHFIACHGTSSTAQSLHLFVGLNESCFHFLTTKLGINSVGALRGSCIDTDICAVFRRWTRFHSVDDYSRIIQSRPAPSSDVTRSSCQLACQLFRRSHFPATQSKIKSTSFDCFLIPTSFHCDFISFSRNRSKITYSCRSVFFWHSFGSSPTRSCQKRKTKLSTRYPPCSDATIFGRLFYSAIFLFQLSFLFYFFLFREEFAAQNCILNSSGPASGTLIVPVSTNTPAHTENTALLAETRTVKTNPS